MDWQILTWGRLENAAAGGLIVLAVGSLAVRLCRQPVRRARLVILTLLGAVAVPCLGALPVVPRWSAGILPAPAPLRSRPDNAAHTAARSHFRLPAEEAESKDAFDRAGRFGETLAGTARPDVANAPPRSTQPSPRSRSTVPPVRTLLMGCYFAVAAGLATWWLVGQFALWRVTRAARPVSGAVRDAFLSLTGPAGEPVVLLESDRIALPFTYTWVRPVILLPSTLCRGGDPSAVRYVLMHEWSHVERRDAWAWNLACLAGVILFYQPLFWWLRRQLRLCQDYLADARAAAAGSAEDYASFLVHLAQVRRSDPALPALGMVDRRSNLSRRVMMLVQDHEPLEHGCRAAWSLSATSVAAAVIVVASGLRLSAGAPPETQAPALQVKAGQDGAKTPGDPKPSGETLNYTGTVRDKDTGKPIAGATVLVRRSVLKSEENRVLQETRHTTGADGTYSFTIPPEQVSERFLYIELDVEHPAYATRAGFGYALSMTRKNETLNERPFFETIEMRPAEPIAGRVETPEGTPAAGVEVLAYSRTDKLTRGHFEYGSFARTKTDAEGKFRLPVTTPGRAVYWVLPKEYAPELHLVANGKRGDLETIILRKGVTVTGRALGVQGNPLAGVFVEADRERGSGPEFEALGQMAVADAIRRTAETDAEGRFTLDPLAPGSYRVMPTDVNFGTDRSAGWTRRELPGVFAPTKLTIKEGEVPEPLEVCASPAVVIEGQWLDSKGQPKTGWGSSVFGRIDGSFWHAMTRPDAQGKFSLKVPHGLEEVELSISTNEHASARHRIGKDGPLTDGRRITLGTLDHDVKGIEIVRYVAPIIVINATTKDGRQVKGFTATVEYTDPGPNKQVHVVGGGKRIEAIQDEQYDGRYRTSQLLPEREVNVTVSADGFATAGRKLTLPEGNTEEVNFVLEPKQPSGSTP
jgi:beta-lactamase regulating signal transducer with metallopeptidase domain